MNTCGLLLSFGLLLGVSSPEDSVVSGRKALDRWSGSYPWYDSQTDGIRPIRVSAPRQSNPSSFNPLPLLRVLAYTVLAVLLIGLVYVLVRLYLSRRRRGLGIGAGEESRAPTDEDRRRIEALPLPADRPRLDLLEQARQFYEQGRYGEAIVYLFSYQLIQLDKHQIIHLTKGKTNRQYLREVGPRRPLRRLVERTTAAFEDFFFGHHPIDRARFESCWTRLTEFEALAAEGGV